MTEIVRTEELTGPALDWAVAKAHGVVPLIHPSIYGTGLRVFVNDGLQLTRWKPSEDRAQGWALIDDMIVKLEHRPNSPLASKANVRILLLGCAYWQSGPTPLVALYRAVVLCICGERVRIPAELMKTEGATL